VNPSNLSGFDLGVTGGDGLDDGPFDLGFLVVVVAAFHGCLRKVKGHLKIFVARFCWRERDGRGSLEIMAF
jgi:hypothetical protein